MIDRIALPLCVVVVLAWMLVGCSGGDFTVAQPLPGAPFDDAATEIATGDADTERDTAPDVVIDSADAAFPPDAPVPDTGPDTPPIDTKPIADTAPPPDDGALTSTPGTVACTNKPTAACAAFPCDESADCGGKRCCLRPDGAGSTCDCSGASMDGWTILCLTEGDCYGGKHCTPWAAWDHHGRCL